MKHDQGWWNSCGSKFRIYEWQWRNKHENGLAYLDRDNMNHVRIVPSNMRISWTLSTNRASRQNRACQVEIADNNSWHSIGEICKVCWHLDLGKQGGLHLAETHARFTVPMCWSDYQTKRCRVQIETGSLGMGPDIHLREYDDISVGRNSPICQILVPVGLITFKGCEQCANENILIWTIGHEFHCPGFQTAHSHQIGLRVVLVSTKEAVASRTTRPLLELRYALCI